MMKQPVVICPKCQSASELGSVLTAQSNQHVIYHCSQCDYQLRNVYTNKGS